ncbi:MAG: biotin--[acetyl-CoA-carboxylase] ligase, partial [Gemmatimonadaceae bacterium]|nr:biotin--[acetyl-CoA-carboxylase] ligase [Gemmatimonadaceae bacterium]
MEIPAGSYDGATAALLAAGWGVPAVTLFETVPSTMDVAHALAETGAPAGTVVLADAQEAGRGRHGRTWTSEPGRGVWLSVVERPDDTSGTDVLSLRIGLAIAEVLEELAPAPIRLKWPNDVFVADGKLGGILSEGRWRSGRLEWLVIGVGVNVHAPATASAGVRAGALRPGVTRLAVLERLVPAIRAAAAAAGPLDAGELARFHARDLA